MREHEDKAIELAERIEGVSLLVNGEINKLAIWDLIIKYRISIDQERTNTKYDWAYIQGEAKNKSPVEACNKFTHMAVILVTAENYKQKGRI